jgi:enoyl-CoA hydratase/carnithine racemase
MKFVSESFDSGILRIQLERPEARNAISVDLLKELHQAIQNTKSREDIRVLALSGSGDSFCAGADLKERAGMTESQIFDFLNLFRDLNFLIEFLEFPTVCLLNGGAYGGGLELAMAFDIRYAKEGGTFGLTETSLGIIPGAGGTQRLPRLIGVAKAKEWIFQAKKFTASEGKEAGLFQEVFSSTKFHDSVDQELKLIASNAPLATKWAKESIQKGYSLNLSDGISLEREIYKRTLNTQDRLEALTAFREKRKPIFKGL